MSVRRSDDVRRYERRSILQYQNVSNFMCLFQVFAVSACLFYPIYFSSPFLLLLLLPSRLFDLRVS